jgi:hypothetical protein
VFAKEVFAPDKLFKAAKAVISQTCPGWEGVKLILTHDKKLLVTIGGCNG